MIASVSPSPAVFGYLHDKRERLGLGGFLTAANYADMTALSLGALGTGIPAGYRVCVHGRATSGDGGQGHFTVLAGSAASNGLADDDGTVLEADDASATFVRDTSEPVTPQMFGAIADGDAANATADTAAIQAAFGTGRSVYFGDGDRHYMVNSVFSIANKTDIHVYGHFAKLEMVGEIAQLLNFSSNNSDLHVHGLVFDGSGSDAVYTVDSGMGLRFSDSRLVTVSACKFQNFVGDCINGGNIGGTGAREEGLYITGNTFRDMRHDATTFSQTCIRCKDDCEYADISHNKFYDCVRAIRMGDGANSVISFNRILGSVGTNWTGAAVTRSNALIWCGVSSNAGKIQIFGNTLNHNEVDCISIVVIGDVTKPQNVNEIRDNHIIVGGDTNVHTAIYLEDSPDSVIRGNSIRYNGGGGIGDQIVIDNSDRARVSGNYVNRGAVGVRLINSHDVIIGGDNEINATDKISGGATSSITEKKRRVVGFRCSSTGVGANPFPFQDVTVSQTGTGEYTVVHQQGTNALAFTATPETAGLIASYAITATNIVVSFEDAAGTATDTDWLGMLECLPGTRFDANDDSL